MPPNPIQCPICGELIEYCGLTAGEEMDAHCKEKHDDEMTVEE
jgi:hypothetical protein